MALSPMQLEIVEKMILRSSPFCFMLQRQACRGYLGSEQKGKSMVKSFHRVMKIHVSNKGMWFTYRVDIPGTAGGILTPQLSCPPYLMESHLCLRSGSGVSERSTATVLIVFALT